MKKIYSLFVAALVLTLAAAPAIAQTAIKPDGTPTALQADASSNLKVASGGDVASGATDTGSPTKIGGAANNSTPTAVSAGQRVNAWFDLNGQLVVATGGNAATTDGVANSPFGLRGVGASGCCFFLGTMNYSFNGTTWDRARGDTNGLAVQPALSANFWSFAGASGGIVNSTLAVTMKAAAGAGVRNYICTLNVGHDTLGAATELAVRDGAAGTVLFRMKLQTAANEGASEVTFAPCLKGTANTLMEVVTLTATVSGGVFVNASGYTGS